MCLYFRWSHFPPCLITCPPLMCPTPVPPSLCIYTPPASSASLCVPLCLAKPSSWCSLQSFFNPVLYFDQVICLLIFGNRLLIEDPCLPFWPRLCSAFFCTSVSFPELNILLFSLQWSPDSDSPDSSLLTSNHILRALVWCVPETWSFLLVAETDVSCLCTEGETATCLGYGIN